MRKKLGQGPCRLVQRNIYAFATAQERGSAMTRFFQWLDKLAMAHPYAAMALFQLP